MAVQLESERLGAADEETEPSPERRTVEPPGHVEPAVGLSIAEAVHRLSRLGYVRTFEPADAVLWCRSSETRFEPGALVVEVVTRVDGGTVLALRDIGSGTAGTWVLLEWTEREQRLLAQLTWARSARPSRDRVDGRRERVVAPNEPLLDLSA